MSSELVNVPLEQVETMANAVAQSGLFGFKNAAQAFALMCVAQADGIPPIKAVQQYHIIEGKPALKSEAMLARFQAAGGKIRWTERTAQRVSLWLSHPQAGELEVTWDTERAKAAGLSGKNQWRAYPTQMMSARCISEGVRALFPACLGGFYTPEEELDMAKDEPRPAPAPQPKPKAAEAPKAPVAKPRRNAETAVEAEVVPESPAESHAPETSPEPEQAQTAPKPKRDPEEMRANFLAWARSATRTKDPQAVMDALGRLGYETLDQVPADDAALRAVTRELRQVPDMPAENMEIPF